MNDQRKILFIDDDELFVSIYANAFARNGFTVCSELNGTAGIGAARAEKPDVILLDLSMSETDGFATLEQLKSDGATKDIPVVILSNHGLREEIDKTRKSGAIDHLIKVKYTPEQLIARINALLPS